MLIDKWMMNVNLKNRKILSEYAQNFPKAKFSFISFHIDNKKPTIFKTDHKTAQDTVRHFKDIAIQAMLTVA